MSSFSEEFTIEVAKSLRYYVRKPDSAKNVHLVYLLHGYGQLAYYFLRKTAELTTDNLLFVAPEVMHRFYLNGTSGRVGASWMTKEMREVDIEENTLALDKLHDAVSKQFSFDKITVIGFSQGGATAARWIANGKIEVDQFVSWASVFPADVSFPESLKDQQKNIFVIGDQDEFFNPENQEKAIEKYTEMGFDALTFNGKHDLDTDTLKKILE